MGLLLLPIPITLIPIQATCQERLWRGVRELHWVLPHGALGVATGAIVIGTVATLRSTTIIITIATTISTAMSAARDKVIGSTIRNTAEMHPMGTGKQPISLAVRGLEIVLAVELEHAQPVAELERDREPAELEHVPVEVELELVQVAAELGLVQVQAEPERDLVVAVPVRGLVEAEPELAPGVAEPVRGHPRARLAVALRTKSVTAAHRRDLPLLAAEDLAAAAAETTREPAAAEAVIAWEVAE